MAPLLCTSAIFILCAGRVAARRIVETDEAAGVLALPAEDHASDGAVLVEAAALAAQNASEGHFQCPEGCLECCRHWGDFWCILAHGKALPKGRDCETAQKVRGWPKMLRTAAALGMQPTASKGKWKARCKFTGGEARSKGSLPGECERERDAQKHIGPRFYGSEVIPQVSGHERGLQPAHQPITPADLGDGGWRPMPHSGFTCPAECAECCGVFFNKFTCILKDRARLPQGRSCKWAKKRMFTEGEVFKSECSFKGQEKKHASKKVGQCSNRYKCCCPNADHWTEEVCLPASTPNEVWMTSFRGSKELYRRAWHQEFQNMWSPCKRPESGIGKYFNTGIHCIKGSYWQRTCPNQCCIRTHTYVRCTYSTYGGRQCTTYYVCDEWERLFTCSTDGGLTQNGVLYRRTATGLGTCMGDKGYDFNIFYLNKPAASGQYRVVPLPQKVTPHLRDKACPRDTWNLGADLAKCPCASDTIGC